MIEIRIDDDFDLDKIADSGQCFRWEKTAEDAYRIVHRSHCLTIRHSGAERYLLSCDEEEYRNIWQDYFDLGLHYRAVRMKIRAEDDPFLHRACEYGRGIRILRQDPWETLISFIISQNKNIPAIKKSIERLCASAGGTKTDADGRSFRLFPSPKAILSLDEEALAGCGLGYRCRYVRAAAGDAAAGKLEFERLKDADEETAMRELTALCGVGVKVASCVSLFGLHHVDAFPVDVWIRRILEREYPGGYPMEQYRPYNGIYQQYMFYYYRKENSRLAMRGSAEASTI